MNDAEQLEKFSASSERFVVLAGVGVLLTAGIFHAIDLLSRGHTYASPGIVLLAVISIFALVSLGLCCLGFHLVVDSARTSSTRDAASLSDWLRRVRACRALVVVSAMGTLAIWIIDAWFYAHASWGNFEEAFPGLLVEVLALLFPGLVAVGLARPFTAPMPSGSKQRWLVVATLVTTLIGTGGLSALFLKAKGDAPADAHTLEEKSARLERQVEALTAVIADQAIKAHDEPKH